MLDMTVPKSQADPVAGYQEHFSDRSLNYYSDQLADIKPQLRHLNFRWGMQTLLASVTAHSSAILLCGALAYAYKRKYAAASFLAAGFLFRQVFKKRGPNHNARQRTPGKDEVALERYALKAQRGDFGKLEVIAFK
jgi:hypothetical protein